MTDKSGSSKRAHLQSVARQLGFNPHELDTPPLPEYTDYLLGWFFELSSGRQSGMGLSPIAWGEIKAWCELTRNSPEPWEIGVIKQLDMLYLEIFGKEKT